MINVIYPTHITGNIICLHQTIRGQSDPPTPGTTPPVLDCEGGGAKHWVPACDDHVSAVGGHAGHLGHGDVDHAGT